MTRDEAVKAIKSHCYFANLVPVGKEALDMAIKALEQEPCEDAISRQAVLEYIEGSDAELGHSTENELVRQDIKELPPVTPQSKTGHWRAIYQGDEIIDYRCSECEFGSTSGKSTYRMHYCPNCGCHMVEPQESEE